MGKKKPTTKLERAKMISGISGKKVNVDKTFGMKNKKGGKAQKQIAIMQMGSNAAANEKAKMKMKLAAKKAQELADAKMLGMGFAKPKLTFKQKLAAKSKAEELKKSQKRDMYTDDREAEMKADGMETWDQEKLDSVIALKAQKDPGNANSATSIVCKHFLSAVEGMKYGWFWECPMGKECKYKHALPPGFILKRDQEDDTEEKISMEQLIEEERQALLKKVLPGMALTKVTEDTFKVWKKRKIMEKKRKEAKARKKLKGKLAAGKTVTVTGRDLFTLGEAKGTGGEGSGGATAGAAGEGDFDLAAMKRSKAAAMDDALAKAAAAGGPADDSGSASMKTIDMSEFNMDLGDMTFNEDDVSSDEEEEEAAGARPAGLGEAAAASGGGGGAAAAPSILPGAGGDDAEQAAAAMALRLNLLDAGTEDAALLQTAEAEVVVGAHCPEGHLMEEGTLEDGEKASCDKCGFKMTAGCQFGECEECDYMLCERKGCLKKAGGGQSFSFGSGADTRGIAVTVDAELFDGEDLDGIDLEGLADDDDEDD